MTDPILQIYLPVFMLVATWLIVFWKQFRKAKRFTVVSINNVKLKEYNRLKKASRFFGIIYTVFGVMTIIYSLFPQLYFVFLPLDKFHQPLINELGLIIIRVAIVWIVFAQIYIDKLLHKYSQNIERLSALDLARYSELMLLTGMLVLFIGFFTTITNLIGLVLVALCVVIYLRMFFSNPPHKIQN